MAPSSTTIWDPTETLLLEHDGCCVGYAASKGRKCQMRISAANVSNMKSVIRDMSLRSPQSSRMHNLLEELAEYGLCRRYHQDQVTDMVNKWSMRISEEYQIEGERHASRSSTTTSARQSATQSSRRADTNSSATRPRPVQIQSQGHIIRRSSSITPTDDIRSIRPSRSSSRTLPQPLAVASPAEPSPPPRSHSSAPSTDPCGHTHVTRRPIDSECPICMEDMSSKPLADIRWCKSSCGRSFHKECQELWRISQTDDTNDMERDARCVFCRADWAPPCPCDEIVPRSIEEESEEESGRASGNE